MIQESMLPGIAALPAALMQGRKKRLTVWCQAVAGASLLLDDWIQSAALEQSQCGVHHLRIVAAAAVLA